MVLRVRQRVAREQTEVHLLAVIWLQVWLERQRLQPHRQLAHGNQRGAGVRMEGSPQHHRLLRLGQLVRRWPGSRARGLVRRRGRRSSRSPRFILYAGARTFRLALLLLTSYLAGCVAGTIAASLLATLQLGLQPRHVLVLPSAPRLCRLEQGSGARSAGGNCALGRVFLVMRELLPELHCERVLVAVQHRLGALEVGAELPALVALVVHAEAHRLARLDNRVRGLHPVAHVLGAGGLVTPQPELHAHCFSGHLQIAEHPGLLRAGQVGPRVVEHLPGHPHVVGARVLHVERLEHRRLARHQGAEVEQHGVGQGEHAHRLHAVLLHHQRGARDGDAHGHALRWQLARVGADVAVQDVVVVPAHV
mmetsp:Transcript_9426/g.17687  ORF Transcript_9426/g.17687 Transcript_9426/m.17687 type:complete len:364 (-) Transcript_9426:1094-2185(-)